MDKRMMMLSAISAAGCVVFTACGQAVGTPYADETSPCFQDARTAGAKVRNAPENLVTRRIFGVTVVCGTAVRSHIRRIAKDRIDFAPAGGKAPRADVTLLYRHAVFKVVFRDVASGNGDEFLLNFQGSNMRKFIFGGAQQGNNAGPRTEFHGACTRCRPQIGSQQVCVGAERQSLGQLTQRQIVVDAVETFFHVGPPSKRKK